MSETNETAGKTATDNTNDNAPGNTARDLNAKITLTMGDVYAFAEVLRLEEQAWTERVIASEIPATGGGAFKLAALLLNRAIRHAGLSRVLAARSLPSELAALLHGNRWLDRLAADGKGVR